MGFLAKIRNALARITPRFGWNMTKSPFFEKMCRKAFDDVDSDKDGALNHAELYVAILKLYDLLNSKLPCHLRVPKNKAVSDMMYTFDKDKTGKLEFPEFLLLCRSLAGGKGRFWESLTFKAAVTVALKLLILPLAAQGIKDGLLQIAPEEYVKPVPLPVFAICLEVLAKSNLPLPI